MKVLLLATVFCLTLARVSDASECKESQTPNFVAKCDVIINPAVKTFWLRKSPEVVPAAVSICLYRHPTMDGLNNQKAVWQIYGQIDGELLNVGSLWSRDSTIFGESRLFQEFEAGFVSATYKATIGKVYFRYDYNLNQVHFYLKDYEAKQPKYNFKLQCNPVVTKNIED